MSNKRKRSLSDDTSLREPSHRSQTAEAEIPIHWKITYPGPIAPSKSSSANAAVSRRVQMHVSPFQTMIENSDTLDCSYLIDPHDKWWSMTRYSNFVILDDKYTSQEFVYVKPVGVDETLPSGNVEDEYWVARCLEVRASDPSHVYALVAWMYWPRELPKCRDLSLKTASGRRSYHGKHELVASNHLQVLDVTTFAGKATVERWTEQDEDDVQIHLYWRQTYNHKTAMLSDLRRHCICHEYYNPDQVMLACSDKSCGIWLHTQCLIDDVLTKTYEKMVATPKPDEKKPKKGRKAVEKKPYDGIFTATISDSGKDSTAFEITDLRHSDENNKKSWKESVKCLKCGAKI